METQQFDAALGGTEQLPYSANTLKFTAARSIEIAAMTESLLRPNNTKLIFQSLPVHMRRRVMSHNSKRLPKKLREGHLEQLKKSGLPPKQKRPSRKYRRRPMNVLDDYSQRQKQNTWLETHIWHAKRFHMITRWDHKLPYAPCDKAFRACYRASSAHCLLQDVSYYTPIKITGSLGNIRDMFSSITNPSCGLGITARCYTSGKREGIIHLYNENSFPFGYIGKIHFLWPPSHFIDRNLWLFVHPSQVKQVKKVLTDFLSNNYVSHEKNSEKRRKILNRFAEQVKFEILPGVYNRFRLTGPKSQCVLAKSLICIDEVQKIETNEWVKLLDWRSSELNLADKKHYWDNVCKATSPAQLPPNIVIGLVIRDPRLSRPSKRTKAVPKSNNLNARVLLDIPETISASPLWGSEIQKTLKAKMMSNPEFVTHVSKTLIVPGEINLEDPKIQSVPIVLVQRPGSQDQTYKKLGYGSGWDIILPQGYALPFWLTFIMFGARSGGLRETESLDFETGQCYLPPDSSAGMVEEKRIEAELKHKYFKLPPSKRMNYVKLGVNSPFICLWKILLQDWHTSKQHEAVEKFFVLRDKVLLRRLQECVTKRETLPGLKNARNCLVAVSVQIVGKGILKRHAHICLPHSDDIKNIENLFEPPHQDPFEEIRKVRKAEHLKSLKKWRRLRVKLNKKELSLKLLNSEWSQQSKEDQNYESDYLKVMKKLWLPNDIKTVRFANSRETLGYLAHSGFSFTEASSCGVGYLPYHALNELMIRKLNQVLVRNITSRKYRIASFKIIETI